MPKCSVVDCGNKSRTLGLCNKHALRLKKYGTTDPTPRSHGTLSERFWRKVQKADDPNECWIWVGNRRPNGYGAIQEGGKGSRTLSAHRLSYEWHHGPIPDGYVVMHKCDTPSCVNPSHLTIGRHSDNTADMIAKGRKRTVAPVGIGNGKAVLDEDKVRFIRASEHLNNAELARMLRVGINTVRGVRIGRCWAHVR